MPTTPAATAFFMYSLRASGSNTVRLWDPDPDFHVFCLCIGGVRRNRLPGVWPLFPPVINEVVLKLQLTGPVDPLLLLGLDWIAAGKPLPCGSGRA